MAVCSIPGVALGESSANNMKSTFELGGVDSEKVTVSVNGSYTFVRDYGQEVMPIELTDDAFDKAYPYQCYGGGSNNRWDNIFKIKLDIPDAKENDCVWISYYYKSATSFTGGNGKQYTGATMSIPQHRNTKNDIVLEMKTAQYVGDFITDDKWHKVDLYMKASQMTGEELSIYFTDMSKPVYYLFAGFRAGVVHFEEGTEYNNDRAYTELGWHLQKENTKELMLNGKIYNVEEDEVYVDADSDVLDIKSVGSDAVYEVNKLGMGKYEVKLYAPGYDKSVDEIGVATFRRRINKSTGEFAGDGTIEQYKVTNAKLTRTFNVNLNFKEVTVVLKVDGEEKTDISDCVGGEKITTDVTFVNVNGESKTFITVVSIYKDGSVMAVIPTREVMTEDTPVITNQYKYILPEDDYEGAEIKLYVINTANMFDIFN